MHANNQLKYPEIKRFNRDHFSGSSCRRHTVRDLSGPELSASDYCAFGAGGRVAVSSAGRVSDG